MNSAPTIDEIAGYSQEELLALYDALRNDSCLYAQTVMPHIVRDVPAMHREIYTLLDQATGRDATLRYLALVLFRGAAKSTLKTFKACHDICHEHEPMFLFLSESEDQSIRDLIAVQNEIECNDMLRVLYGDLKGDTLWNRTECEFRNGIYCAARGWRSKIRGIKWKFQRPTKVWLDDFEGEGNTKTKEAREAVVQWINAQVMPTGDVDPIYIFLGTIVHPEAYLSKIKDIDLFNSSIGKYYTRAIADDYEGNNPAWARRYPKEWIQSKYRYYQEIGKLPEFYQEYFNTPAAASAPKFAMDRIECLDGVTFQKAENVTYLKTTTGQKVPVNTYVGVDPAAMGADNAVLFCIGVLPTDNYVIIDILADKLDFVQQLEQVFWFNTAYRPRITTIETYAYQKSLAEWIRKKQQETKFFFAIQEYRENISKSNKYLEGLCPLINEGRVAYLPSCRNIDLFLQEGRNFTGGVRDHDDTLDGMFLACHKAFKPPMFDVDKRIQALHEAVKNKDQTKTRNLWKIL